MVVRLRLARHGTKNNPFYHVVAIRDKAARDARPIEKLGEYDPIPRPKMLSGYTAGSTSASASSSASSSSSAAFAIPDRVTSSGIGPQKVQLEKRLEWNAERLQYWLSVGAQPSKTVAKLLDKAKLIPEGKTYKGIYRPISEREDLTKPSSRQSVSPSAILQAAGALEQGQTLSEHSSDEGAKTALKQEETSEPISDRTDPKEEARKSGIAETSIDQAA